MPHRTPHSDRSPRSFRARFSSGPISPAVGVDRRRSRAQFLEARHELSIGKPNPLVHPVLAARLGKIVALMRATAFLAVERAHCERLRRIKPAPQFKPLDKARIVNPLTRHSRCRQIAFAHRANAIERLAEGTGGPE